MCRIISFISARGGLGKTSIIKYLSEALAKRDKKVCVFDGVFELNNISLKFEREKGVDLADFLIGKICSFAALNKASENLFFVKTNEVGFNYYSKSELILRFIFEISQSFDFILIEVNALDFKNLALFLKSCNEVFVLVNQDSEVLRNTFKLLKQLNYYQNITNVKLLINEFKVISQIKNQLLSEEEISKILKTEIIFSFQKFLKNNPFNFKSSEPKIEEKFYSSVMNNCWQKFDYKKNYKGIFGKIKQKIYLKFE